MGKVHDRFKRRDLAGHSVIRNAQERQRKLDKQQGIKRLGDGILRINGGPPVQVTNVTITPEQPHRSKGKFEMATRVYVGESKSVAPRKGHRDELCNRTACQKPGAYYFNTGTRAYYCLDCACQIRPWGLPDVDLFPGLKPDDREDDFVKEVWQQREDWVRRRTPGDGLVAAERRASELFRIPHADARSRNC